MIKKKKKNKKKKRIRLETWAEMYREYLESGKTIKAWCEENGIARTTFHNRLRQIREAALEPKHEIVPVNADAGSMNIPTVAAEGVIRIAGRGIAAELPQDISPELLTALLKGRSSC